MPLEMLWFTNAFVKMQDLTSMAIAMIYSKMRQSHAIKLQLLGEQANFN
jgi:hypothetical protein